MEKMNSYTYESYFQSEGAGNNVNGVEYVRSNSQLTTISGGKLFQA